MKNLLVLVQAGDVDPITGQGAVRLGLARVDDSVEVNLHAPLSLPADQVDVVASLLREAHRQFDVPTFARLQDELHNSGLSASELYGFLTNSFTPERYLTVLAKFLGTHPDGTAELAIQFMHTALAGHDPQMQPGTIAKAERILRYVIGGNLADFQALVGQPMPERWRSNKAPSDAINAAVAGIQAAGQYAAKVEQAGKPQPVVRNVMTDVAPQQSENYLGPKAVAPVGGDSPPPSTTGQLGDAGQQQAANRGPGRGQQDQQKAVAGAGRK